MIYRRFPLWAQIVFGLLTLFTIGFIAYESLVAVGPQPAVAHLDKLVHLVAYGALGVITLPALSRISPLLICLGLGLFGAGIEIAQGSMGIGRSADLLDGLANLCGAILAVFAWAVVSKIRKPNTSESRS